MMNGSKLKHLREQENYAQEHVASKIDMSQNTYSRLERVLTKISLDKAAKLAELYKVPVWEIIDVPAPNTYVTNNQEVSSKVIGYINNFHEAHKETFEFVMQMMKDELAELRKEREQTKEEKITLQQEIVRLQKEIEQFKKFI